MDNSELDTADWQGALAYCRAAHFELAQFARYFEGTSRLPAVDSAILNVVRMRVEILGEQIDAVETVAAGRTDLLVELGRASNACCDFLIAWAPHLMAGIA